MAKKETKKAPAKVAKVAAKPKPSSVQFESFTVRAVIPVQAYGNIQPEITVKAASFEEARDFVMPKIEALWKQYAERTINGESREFTGPVAVEEKVVVPKEDSSSSAPAHEEEAVSTTPSEPTGPKPAPVLKAEKAIVAASDVQTALGVQDQIEKSSKIPGEWKPMLITLVLKKRNALK